MQPLTTEERQSLVNDNFQLAARTAGHAMKRFGLPQDLREDVAAAAALGLVEAAARFDPARGVSFEALARRRVFGEIVDHLRRARPAPELTHVSLDEELSIPAGAMRGDPVAERTAQAREALRSLSSEARELLRERFANGASLSEIAERQGLSKSWVSRVLARTIQEIGGQEGRELGRERRAR